MNKLNIFIVEDEVMLATLLKFMLHRLGHNVCGVAESYCDAVKELSVITPDLVITDIMLKGNETGIDIARYIKAYLNIPFMFLSSISDQDMINDALSTKPVSFLKKPVTKESLNHALSILNTMNISGFN